ncbi:MAG: SNF2-related protein [Spirochaetaceae bacterium]
MITKYGASYLMYDMGMGKTLTCILAMKKVGMPVLVMAPLNAALNTWPAELKKWAPDLTYTVLHGRNKEVIARRSHTYDVIILNFEGLYWWYKMVQKKIFKLRKYFVVWDESSMLKDFNTKRWSIIAEAMPIWSRYRVCLSGTPMPNSMIDLWSQYYLLDEGRALTPSFYTYRSTFFNYTGPPTYRTTIKPNADEKIFDRIAPITDRLDADDYLDLPEVIHNDISLELPPKLRRIYDKMEEDFQLEFPEGCAIANSEAVLASKLRQFLQGGMYYEAQGARCLAPTREVKTFHNIKAELLKSIVDTSGGKPVLAPIQFSFEYQIMCDTFKKFLPIIHGKTKAEVTAKHIAAWNAGAYPVMLCHPRSVAYSLNLQAGGHIIYWAALPWEMELYKQLIARLRRQGQTSSQVIVHRPIFRDTKDERVARVLADKNANQEDLFNAVLKRRRKYYGRS